MRTGGLAGKAIAMGFVPKTFSAPPQGATIGEQLEKAMATNPSLAAIDT